MQLVKRFSFPSTFEIALLLSLIVFVAAIWWTRPSDVSYIEYGYTVLSFWKSGFWDLLEFTMQMVLILVFGHTLALSKPVDSLLRKLSGMVNSNTQAVLLTGSMAMAGGYLNWGFGLVLGAILARKIGESAQEKKISINYPLVAASGYLGMLVWHGGLSGSSTLKVAESGHFLQEVIGLVPIDQTVFSAYNLWGNLILILVLLGVMFWLSRKQYGKVALPSITFIYEGKEAGRDKTGLLVGALMAMLIIVEILKIRDQDWSFIDLNFVNFTLLALGLMLFGSLKSFASALSHAVKGATDIILQFPFYAGILGMMKYSGLLLMLAEDMVFRSGPQTFPVLSFLSAALVNFFIPSGGGQWAIQGPVMMEAAIKMGLDIPKMIMAFAYGDQLSNMLQPFWALPLLSITGVPAKEIFRYTVYFFLAATLVFGFSVWLWVA